MTHAPAVHHIMSARLKIVFVCLLVSAVSVAADSAPADVDPLVKASAYGDKSVWSYHDKDPIPWAKFRPRYNGSSKVEFNAEGVRPVGQVPAPGVHPCIFFSSEYLPAILGKEPATASFRS